MPLEKIITITASLLGAFWIILQIVSHVHEKGHRFALMALAVLALAVPVGYVLQRVPGPPATPVSPEGPPLTKQTVEVDPVSPPPPARSLAALPVPSPSLMPVLSSPSVSMSASPLASGSPFDPSAAPVGSEEPRPSVVPASTLQAAFNVLVSHNLVGGAGRVSLHCLFTGSGAPTFTGYTITIHAQMRGDTDMRDHVFDRVLETPILVSDAAPVIRDVVVDTEIGDLLVAYRKNPASDWVRLTWHGHGQDGQPIQIESANNTTAETR